MTPPLPVPLRERWQPLRSGLVNLYRYDQQEFWFEGGRLLLRGNNGTGKSRVLALQLPFLLDGEVSPHRIEPDGDQAKRLEWNLLMDRHEQRVGYSWIELGRRDADGTEHFLTLGCGLSAVKGRGAPHRWFFLTPKRIARDLFLVADRTPLSRERLRLALGPEALFDQPAKWREAVDARLFGLGRRYDALLDLLIQLRQPQLSRQLNEDRLSQALSTALPPLPARVVDTLAQAFRAMESDRVDVEGFRAAAGAAEDFLARYRRYAQVAARRRAATLRTSHAAHDRAARELRQATEALDQAREALVAAKAAEQTGLETSEAAETVVRTLERAPEMDLARELDVAARDREATAAARTRAGEEQARAGRREVERGAEATEANVRADREANRAAAALEHARAGAGSVGLAEALPGQPMDPGDETAWVRVLDGRERAARQLAEAEAAVARAERRRQDAAADHDRQQSALERAREREMEAARTLADRRAMLLAAWDAWAAGLTILRIDVDGVRAALEAWSEDPRGPNPAGEAAQAALERVVEALAAREAELQARARALTEERQCLEEESARLAAGVHRPPSMPPTRDAASRTDRLGAPFWRLCDFREDVDEATRRSLEAALEAAGLLDAWVTPAGAVLPAGIADAALTLDAPALEPNAGRWLVALDGPVARSVVEGLLARIGAGAGTTWIDAEGRFGLGPLRGAWHKDALEHIGETAREAARRRRLVELAALIAEVGATLAMVEQSREAVVAQRAAARAEARTPDDALLRRAEADRAAAGRATGEAQRILVACEATLLAAREEEEGAAAHRHALARDLGLAAWVGRPEALRAALAEVRSSVHAFRAEARAARDAAAANDRARKAHEEARADRKVRETEHAEADRAHREAEVRWRTIHETHGAAVDEIVRRLEAARQQLVAARRHHEDVRRAHAEADKEAALKEAALLTARARTDEAEARRSMDAESLARLVAAGLLEVVGMALPEGAWNATRAIELARQLEAGLGEVVADDAAWSRVQNALFADIEELRRALLPHRLDPLTRTEDQLHVVVVPYQDREQRVPELHARLREEALTREAILNARERGILENHLVGDMAVLLHELIHGGETLVREMSREVESRQTSTGMRLRFTWGLRADAGPALEGARQRLLRQGATWGPGDREALAGFLKSRLDDQRAADPGGTWQAHIERAFDYRSWHVFRVDRHQDGQWKPLTRRTHGTGSGGEKALALTMPQFAAAAAYYRNAHPHAPRLILLDEVFVGIDSDMRAKCMGLLAAFDLDFVMTSEREWGCYATLPGVAVCQLATHPGIDAIDVTRWVWNGRERVRADMPATPLEEP